MEFEAIVLCGPGANLDPFTTTRDSIIPKALLPIANKPMLHYVMEWCKQALFSQITVACDSESKTKIEQFLEASQFSKSLNVTVLGTDIECTGDIIASIRPKKDFVVLPCDIITDIAPQDLIDIFRSRQPNIVLTSFFYKNAHADKKNLENDYIVHTADNVLLDSYSRETVQQKKALKLRMLMLWRHDNVSVATDAFPASISFCSSQVSNLLKVDDGDDDDDRAQESTESSEYGVEGAFVDSSLSRDTVHPVVVKDKSWHRVVRDIGRRSWRHRKPLKQVCYCMINDEDASKDIKDSKNIKLFVRCNNLISYMEGNRHMLQQLARNKAQARVAGSGSATMHSGQANIGPDCVVGESSTLGEKTVVKKSAVGNNCVIGKKCRINGSVILDDVTIEDDVILENCLVGKGVVIKQKANLVNCTVQGGNIVAAGFHGKGETLLRVSGANIQGLAESGDLVMDEDSDDDDDEDGDYEEEEEEELIDDDLFE